MQIQQIVLIFNQSIQDYHVHDSIDTTMQNPYPANSFEAILYHKNWIDTIQWHFEDIIREPSIRPLAALELKRKIDAHNQIRTDLVEQIDDYFYEQYQHVALAPNFRLNTETIGWAIDRLSIACLKIYHMSIEATRQNASVEHQQKCQNKLNILLQQQADLCLSITQLEEAIQKGVVKNLRYKQMKMYNDPSLNPMLYAKK